MKKLLCFIGWRWLINHEHSFVDKVSGKDVYRAKCVCGKKEWLTDSATPLFGFRI